MKRVLVVLLEIIKHLLVFLLWGLLWGLMLYIIPHDLAVQNRIVTLIIICMTVPNLYTIYKILKPYNRLIHNK